MTKYDVVSQTKELFVKINPKAESAIKSCNVEFVAFEDMLPTARKFCSKNAPQRNIPSSTTSTTMALAFPGNPNSLILLCNNISYDVLSTRLYHELMHIFCAKNEVENKHFIDIYGTVVSWKRDAVLDTGYYLWSEFFAEYCALKATVATTKKVSDLLVRSWKKGNKNIGFLDILNDVVDIDDSSINACYRVCAELFSCDDFLTDGRFLPALERKLKNPSYNKLIKLIGLFSMQLSRTEPYKITEGFIHLVGECYIDYVKTIQNTV